ncbi:hypothetical protein GCM10007205_25000 [Oxalicibacterium flavum]|uniref:GmrSD restriction endonucleases N-terminal domain-containing protein n=1 Tax=Oxalicibacterium flavum TaxID=179467 RepID=A0A8J2UNQ0_9BURK|nr:DUF262 domain-containing protein [Oxalicibacterium flavum]GGC15080.1 hypothetical protein GCM10007205_25000 [Oxalicibacterium flavum]
MTVNSIPIRQLLGRVAEGEVRIPAFQREFVWEPDRVQFLMDSIYKGYPIGTLLFWRTREKLQSDRDLGPYVLPEPKEQYPIDYVLDGQQRLTSIFAVFQTELKQAENPKVDWVDVYFDIHANADAQDSQFLALRPDEVDETRHFPLNVLFDVTAYGARVRKLNEEEAKLIDDLQNRFKEAQIPVETIETDDHSKIAIVFERVNRGGVPLDTYQLLAAWTWSGEFDLRNKFDDLAAELDDGGYGEIGNDPDLLLKCAAGVISNDSSAHAVVALKGSDVRDQFPKLTVGIKGAVEFLQKQCGVVSLKVLPYKSMLIPLVRFFATDNANGYHPDAKQQATLRAWFWISCFSRRYSNSVNTSLDADIKAAILLRDKKDSSLFDLVPPKIVPEFFLDNVFSLTAVNTKTFVLLLASKFPRSFLSGANIDLDAVLLSCNRTEFHHIYPKSYLADKLGIIKRDEQFRLANFAFLSQTDNRIIKNRPPSEYVSDIPGGGLDDILTRAMIPKDSFNASYEDFCRGRAELLAQEALALCKV